MPNSNVALRPPPSPREEIPFDARPRALTIPRPQPPIDVFDFTQEIREVAATREAIATASLAAASAASDPLLGLANVIGSLTLNDYVRLRQELETINPQATRIVRILHLWSLKKCNDPSSLEPRQSQRNLPKPSAASSPSTSERPPSPTSPEVPPSSTSTAGEAPVRTV